MKKLMLLLLLCFGIVLQGGMARAETRNNGGWFVEAEGRVYFREYGAGALAKQGLDGTFDSLPSRYAESAIMYYDRADGRVHEAFKDNGFGPMVYNDGWLYLVRTGEPGRDSYNELYRVSADGNVTEKLRGNALRASSPDGSLIAVESRTPYGTSLCIMKQGTEYTQPYETESELCVLGMDEKFLYYLERNRADGQMKICRMDTEGSSLLLGSYAVPSYTDSVCRSFHVSDGTGTAEVQEYEGTARTPAGRHTLAFSGTACTITSQTMEELISMPQRKWDTEWGDMEVRPEGVRGTGFAFQQLENVLPRSNEYFAMAARYHEDMQASAGWHTGSALLSMEYLRLDDNSITKLAEVKDKEPLIAYCKLLEENGESYLVYQLAEVNGPEAPVHNDSASYMAPLAGVVEYRTMNYEDGSWNYQDREALVAQLRASDLVLTPQEVSIADAGCHTGMAPLYDDQRPHIAYHLGFNEAGEICAARPVFWD